MTVLVTGAAGFIGMNVSLALMARGETVVGIDNVNDYYDVSLKEARLARLMANDQFSFVRADICDARLSPKPGRMRTGSCISRPRPGCATASRIGRVYPGQYRRAYECHRTGPRQGR